MPDVFSLEIKDFLTPELKKALAGVADKRPCFSAMASAVQNIATRSFRMPALRPSPWAPLKPYTLKRKGGKRSLLIDFGALIRSLEDKTRAIVIEPDHAEIGTDRHYAPYLQLGTKKMPARPFLPVTPDNALTERAARDVQNALSRRLASLGFKGSV
jgi:phage gpG-like protein